MAKKKTGKADTELKTDWRKRALSSYNVNESDFRNSKKANSTSREKEVYINVIRTERLNILAEEKFNSVQNKFAKELDLPESSVSLYLRGKGEPSSTTLARMAAYFNVSTDYLLGRTDNRTADLKERYLFEYIGLPDDESRMLNTLTHDKEHPLHKVILAALIRQGKLQRLIELLERAIVTSYQYNLLYDSDKTEQIESLEYQFTKQLGDIFTTITNDIYEHQKELIYEVADKRWLEIVDAAIDTDARMDYILQRFINAYPEADAKRIKERIENAKKDPSAQ